MVLFEYPPPKDPKVSTEILGPEAGFLPGPPLFDQELQNGTN